MLKPRDNSLPPSTRRKWRLQSFLPMAFLMASLLFIASMLLIVLRWWSPSPWQPFHSATLPHLADPQHYTIADVDFYLVWLDHTPLALSTVTPTLQAEGSCQIRWAEGEQLFVDPCGGSRFLRDGSYKYGPAPRSLSRLPVRIVNDTIEIDPMHIQLGVPHS
jgi:hypothetical protein